ncbi:hypothetical protein D1007_05623 [Hordeum vulgare]|nr:hypothetical protein D1007_05623 [Hordeum vulgare]
MKECFDERNKSGIERTNRSIRFRWSTINKDCQRWATTLKSVDTINPSGTNDRDMLNIAQYLFREEEKKAKKVRSRMEERLFPRCYEVLKDVEKWKTCDEQEESKRSKATIDLDDDEEASSDDGKRSPTPKSVAYSKPKRPNGSKKEAKEKKKRRGDDELMNATDDLLEARKEATEVRRMARIQDAMAEERRLAAEERRVAAEERKMAL